MSDQELTGQGGVAPGQATGAETPGEGGAVAQQAGATAAQAQPIAEGPGEETPKQQKVDLTTLPEFRQYQSAVDREKEAARRRERTLQQQLQQMQAQQGEVMRQFEALRLQGAEPEEAVAFLQQQLTQEREAHQRAVKEQAVAAELNERATDMLARLGLDWHTPGLDMSGGATEEGYVTLLESAVRIAGEQAGQARTEAEEAAKKAAQQAQVETARQMGATQVSTSTGPGAPTADFFQGERDPVKRLGMALRGSKKK